MPSHAEDITFSFGFKACPHAHLDDDASLIVPSRLTINYNIIMDELNIDV